MKKYISLLVFAAVLFSAVSCKKDPFLEPDRQEGDRKEVIYLWASKPAPEEEHGANKVIYHDGLGISGKDSLGFNMEWEANDMLYAILWNDADSVTGEKAQATDKYIILSATQTKDGHQMLFQGTTQGGLKISSLKGGEHFVLIHGHFVLDPSTDGGVIDFPTSEVTKTGYASHIHYGGVINGSDLTFRNQDGTLANLKKHEYMIADSYVRFQKATEKAKDGSDTIVIVPYLGSKDPTITTAGTKDDPDLNPTGVQMRSAHTLLRLTMFVPDTMFNEDIDYRLLAVSLRTVDNSAIFHRYFRLHPNTTGIYGPNSWKVDWNDHGDKESNIYFRANLPGTRKYNEINDPASNTFDQSKTVCVAGSNGHYVTLYFSLPSRPLAPDAADGNGIASDTPSKLFVTAFTRTHAFRINKAYTIKNESMRPGKIVILNANFANNHEQTKAVTDPNLGVTFAPGLVYATKNKPEDAYWTYGVYENQGEYAGLDQQTDVMGDYFIFGSIDPREVFHQHKNQNGSWTDCSHWNKTWKINEELKIALDANNQAIANGTTDVAALATLDGYNNIFSTMSKKEADRVWARIQLEAQQGINRGYYYYDAKAHDIDYLHHTAHQAKGAWRNLAADDQRRKMSSTIGIWIGIDHQPTLEEQDKYVFLPSSNQLNNSTSNMVSYEAVLDTTQAYEDAEHYRYWASTDYGNQHVKCIDETAYNNLSESDKALYANIPTKHWDGSVLNHYYLISDLTGTYTATMKFSTNTRIPSGASCERFQVWYAGGNSFHSNSGIKLMDQTFGRVVRPVIY